MLSKGEDRLFFFSQEKAQAHQESNSLADVCGNGGPRHSHGKTPYHEIVQDNVGEKTCDHGRHGCYGAAHIPDERHQPSAQNLKNSSQRYKENIFSAQGIDFSCGSKKSQHRSSYSHKQKSKENPQSQKEKKGHAEKFPASSGLLAAHGNGVFYGSAHAYAGACGLEKGGEGIGHVNGSQGAVPHSISHKETVGDGVDSGQGESQHGGNYILKKFFMVFHQSVSPKKPLLMIIAEEIAHFFHGFF